MRKRVAVGDEHAHDSDVRRFEQVGPVVVDCVVVHGAVVEARLENRAGALADLAIFRIHGPVLAAAAPGEVAQKLAVLVPPAIPTEQRREGFLDEPAVAVLLIKSQRGDCSDGRLGAVRTFPLAGARVIGDEPLGGFFMQHFDEVTVGEILVADAGQRRAKEGVPVEEHVATPIGAPVAADRRDDAAVGGIVDRVPARVVSMASTVGALATAPVDWR